MKRIFTAFAATLAFAACKKDNNNSTTTTAEVVYVETNDFAAGQNAVLAYRHSSDGSMTPLTGSPFATGGTGLGNPMQALGPADSDNELWITADKKFLLAVNSGSNTIAVFSIAADGGLTAVPGSPFASNGETPCSIYMADNYVYIVNKSQNPLQATGSNPNYTTFMLSDAGQLTPLAGSKIETTASTSPSQSIISSDKKFAFGDDWLGFMQTPAVGTLRSFTNSNGVLTPIDTPQVIPEMGGALGLWQHPTANILYVGFPVAGKVGVYGIDANTGKLTYQSDFAAGTAACWIRTNKAGSHLYVLNSGDNAVQVYNSATAAVPVSISTLKLKNAGPVYQLMGANFTTSEDFSVTLSPDENYMYVVCQHTNTDFGIGNYNYLHTLTVAADGSLTEPGEPMQLPVANTIRPKGVVAVKIK